LFFYLFFFNTKNICFFGGRRGPGPDRASSG
jgi:hypothetical protein